MGVNVSIPKGTRDFGPLEMKRRNYIFDIIKSVFNEYGFLPIETPAMENLSTLLGKYGDEGDKLLFKILNSGDFIKNIDITDFNSENLNHLVSKICEKGLRYDLTVPFARFVVQHRNEIVFPFKRYQIQPVWRADRPQKGRYREFYQCDVDVIGSNSLFNEFELIQIIDKVFNKLGIKVVVKLNNRKILAGLSEVCGIHGDFIPVTVAIDKIEKIGIENTRNELIQLGIKHENVDKLLTIVGTKRNNQEQIAFLKSIFDNNSIGAKGIKELEEVFNYLSLTRINSEIEIDLSLARGLNYYTGAIFEVKALEYQIGSICGGGRYDDLTGIFGLKDVSGVGISFGADRIYDVMLGLNLFPQFIESSVNVMFVNFGGNEIAKNIELASLLRNEGISCEIYPHFAKIDKQFKYADNKNIQFVVIIGEEELKECKITVKDLKTGIQEKILDEQLVQYFIEKIKLTE